jgi:hydroxymethylpyrimidine/phosphomethylpyrimidine kinase
MQQERPYVLSIAGFDPSSGAGVSADIKTFEQMKVYGLAVCTGLTLQTEDKFISVDWRKTEDVMKETELMLEKYPVKAVKFGIVPSYSFLKNVAMLIKKINSETKIVVDPVWRSSTGFTFNGEAFENDPDLLRQVDLFTPNLDEFDFMRKEKNASEFLNELLHHTNILLKGGHSAEKKGSDVLHQKNSRVEISPETAEAWPKHGSGCVLSAAITAKLALGENLEEACKGAKQYIEKYLNSNKSLLGFHAA